VKFSTTTSTSNVAVVKEADQTSSARTVKEAKTLAMVAEVLLAETEKTQLALQQQREFVNSFWEHAADRLLAVLAKVYAEVQLSMMKEESKIYFRSV
jgi:3-deoxy-D-manno-octulosonic-acid transferase